MVLDEEFKTKHRGTIPFTMRPAKTHLAPNHEPAEGKKWVDLKQSVPWIRLFFTEQHMCTLWRALYIQQHFSRMAHTRQGYSFNWGNLHIHWEFTWWIQSIVGRAWASVVAEVNMHWKFIFAPVYVHDSCYCKALEDWTKAQTHPVSSATANS